MEYVCLAAGKGSRFGGLGSYLQKCMYPLIGKPFVEYTLSEAVDAGARRITFVIGHLGHQLRDYFGFEYRGTPIEYIEQEKPLGTGHAVHEAFRRHGYDSPVIIWLADAYFSADEFTAISALAEYDAVTLYEHRCDRPHHERVDYKDGRVIRAYRGTGPYIENGLWKFSPELMETMGDEQEDEYRALLSVQRAIERGSKIGAIFTERRINIGDTEPSFRQNIAEVTGFFVEWAKNTDNTATADDMRNDRPKDRLK